MTVDLRGHGALRLAADIRGSESGPPVVLLHGGGQTRYTWDATGRMLAEAGFLAIAPDQRGHGESDWAPDADYSADAYVGDLRALLGHLGRPAALVGASLGGIVSLLAAGEAPRIPCTAVVLVDVSPRMAAGSRDRITRFVGSHPQGFASLEEAADAVAEFLPHRARPSDLSGLERNLRRRDDGRYHWHWDPALLRSEWARDTDPERLEKAAGMVTAPILLIRGSRSDIVTDAGASAFLANAPGAEYVVIEGARHMVAGDRNDAFAVAVLGFLIRRNAQPPQKTRPLAWTGNRSPAT